MSRKDRMLKYARRRAAESRVTDAAVAFIGSPEDLDALAKLRGCVRDYLAHQAAEGRG